MIIVPLGGFTLYAVERTTSTLTKIELEDSLAEFLHYHKGEQWSTVRNFLLDEHDEHLIEVRIRKEESPVEIIWEMGGKLLVVRANTDKLLTPQVLKSHLGIWAVLLRRGRLSVATRNEIAEATKESLKCQEVTIAPLRRRKTS